MAESKSWAVVDGVYQHFRGRMYVVIARAEHTESGEMMVIYRAFEDVKGEVWCRPESMFLDNVQVSGELVHRFDYQFSSVE